MFRGVGGLPQTSEPAGASAVEVVDVAPQAHVRDRSVWLAAEISTVGERMGFVGCIRSRAAATSGRYCSGVVRATSAC